MQRRNASMKSPAWRQQRDVSMKPAPAAQPCAQWGRFRDNPVLHQRFPSKRTREPASVRWRAAGSRERSRHAHGVRAMDNTESIAFDFIDDIAVFRIVGQFTLPAGIELIRKGIARAREQGIPRMMVVITETSGYEVPSLSMRLSMMRQWADAAGGTIRLVMVCRPEFIDPHKFGVTMAANFGMVANVFETEGEAMDWLRQS